MPLTFSPVHAGYIGPAFAGAERLRRDARGRRHAPSGHDAAGRRPHDDGLRIHSVVVNDLDGQDGP